MIRSGEFYFRSTFQFYYDPVSGNPADKKIIRTVEEYE